MDENAETLTIRMLAALTCKINRLIDQRNALQRLITVLDEQRIRLERPHLKGEKGI